MGKLVHFHADGSAVEIKLDRQRITIGRRPDNDFCLPYPAVSGEHAVVVTILADSFLEDLGSTNGTLVNGGAVTKHFLRDRDEITVGQQILVYVVDDAVKLEPPQRTGKAGEEIGNREPVGATLAVPAAPGAKRRPDSIAPVFASPAAAMPTSGVAANGDDADPAEPAPIPAAAPPPRRRIDVEPALKVMSGAKAGRIVPLVKDETLIGRAGIQVVALRRAPDELLLVPVEGDSPPSVNGVEVVPEGQSLAVGDVLEIAGTKLEVIAAAKRTSG